MEFEETLEEKLQKHILLMKKASLRYVTPWVFVESLARFRKASWLHFFKTVHQAIRIHIPDELIH
jgi:hypothetical protein